MKPILQALLLAERVYEEKDGRKIICGTFNQLFVLKAPEVKTEELPDGRRVRRVPAGTETGCPWVYVSLTDVVDGTEVTLQFVNVSKNQTVVERSFRIQSTDRLATIEVVGPMPPLSHLVKEPGTYSLDVIWNNEILGSHRVRVAEHSDPEGEEDEPR